MELQPLTPERIALIGGTLLALAALSWKFNDWIDRQTETDPLGAYSAQFTVLGVSYTLLGAFVILGLLFGWNLALFAIAILFLAFGVAGVPMILGDMRRGGRRRRSELERQRSAYLPSYEEMEQ